MKKKILSGIFALALLTIAGYGVSKSLNGNADLSLLALSNVEALADGENGGTPVRTCYIGKIYEDAGAPTSIQPCDSRTNSTMIYPCPTEIRGRIYSYTYSNCTI